MVSYLKSDLSNVMPSRDSFSGLLDDEYLAAEAIPGCTSFRSSNFSSKMFHSSVSSSLFLRMAEDSDKGESGLNEQEESTSDSKYSSNNMSLVDMFDPDPSTVLRSSADLPEESFEDIMMSIGKSFQKHMSICSTHDAEENLDKEETQEIKLPLACFSLHRQVETPSSSINLEGTNESPDDDEQDEGLGIDLDELAKHLLPPPSVSKPRKVAAAACFDSTSAGRTSGPNLQNKRGCQELGKCEPRRRCYEQTTPSSVMERSLEKQVPVVSDLVVLPAMRAMRPAPPSQIARTRPARFEQAPPTHHFNSSHAPHQVQPERCVPFPGPSSSGGTTFFPQMPAVDPFADDYLVAAERLRQSMQRSMSSRSAIKQQGGFAPSSWCC